MGAVVGVTSARGGAGASSLGAVLAHAARDTGSVLVDLDGSGSGIDVLLGIEETRGPRWPDLRDAGGDAGERIAVLLPRWRGVPVLSVDRRRPGVPAPVRDDVLAALREAHGLTVLDLPRPSVAGLAEHCDLVVVVTPRDLTSVAGAVTLRAATASAGRAALVIRGPAPGRLRAAEVEEAVGLPALAAVRADLMLAADLERGTGPRRGPRSPLGRAARAVLRALGSA